MYLVHLNFVKNLTSLILFDAKQGKAVKKVKAEASIPIAFQYDFSGVAFVFWPPFR